MDGTNLLDNLEEQPLVVEETPEPAKDKSVIEEPKEPSVFEKRPSVLEKKVESKEKMDFLKESTANAISSTKNPVKEKGRLDIDTTKIKEFAINFIVPIVSLSVSTLLFLTIILPSIKKLPERKRELSQKQTLKDTLANKSSNLERLLDFKSIVDENSTLIDSVLVSEEMVPELLSQVDHISKEANLEVTRLSYSLSQAGSGSLGYPAVDISLGVTGTFDQFVTFLKLTEGAARLVEVSNYRYSVGSKDENMLNLNIVLRSPYLYVNSEAVTDDAVDLDITSTEFSNFVNKLKGLKYYDPNEIPIIENIEETPEEEEVLVDEANIPSAEGVVVTQ